MSTSPWHNPQQPYGIPHPYPGVAGGYPPPRPSPGVRVHPVLGLPLAGFGHRLGARVIDYVLLTILVSLLTFGILLFLFVAYPEMEETSRAFDGVLGLLFLFGWGVAAFLYDWFFVAAASRTPGKMMTGLKVVSVTGAPPAQGQSALRSAAFGLPHSLPCLGHVLVFVACLFVLGDENSQALHDKMSRTVVVVTR
ncbi:RDD family protein [Thermobifida halotolerans]|uniref:RDD family protein n=1 Tax=Thermobifida halotolerans TaxID=483545 RepID=UPI001F372602|nr:RDD family protein [Thermobifida halotolerans]